MALTLPILVGLDGARKMSKSYGNHIGVSEEPNAQFGKAMSLPDGAMKDWFTLLTGIPIEEVAALADPAKTHPREAKDRLAREIVAAFHGEAAARAASEHFAKVISRKELPDEIPVIALPGLHFGDEIPLPNAMKALGVTPSTSSARLLIAKGAVIIQDEKITDVNYKWRVNREDVWKVGKKGKVFRVRIGEPEKPSPPGTTGPTT